MSNEQALIRNCRFAFRCHQQWRLLEATEAPGVRYCHECAQDVVLCDSDAELREALRANQCVAIATAEDPLAIHTVGLLLPHDKWGQ